MQNMTALKAELYRQFKMTRSIVHYLDRDNINIPVLVRYQVEGSDRYMTRDDYERNIFSAKIHRTFAGIGGMRAVPAEWTCKRQEQETYYDDCSVCNNTRKVMRTAPTTLYRTVKQSKTITSDCDCTNGYRWCRKLKNPLCDDGYIECYLCKGHGTLISFDGSHTPCSHCYCKGKVLCPDCNGNYRVPCGKCINGVITKEELQNVQEEYTEDRQEQLPCGECGPKFRKKEVEVRECYQEIVKVAFTQAQFDQNKWATVNLSAKMYDAIHHSISENTMPSGTLSTEKTALIRGGLIKGDVVQGFKSEDNKWFVYVFNNNPELFILCEYEVKP